MRSELNEQRRRIQTLEYLNSVLSNLVGTGFSLNPIAIEVISNKT